MRFSHVIHRLGAAFDARAFTIPARKAILPAMTGRDSATRPEPAPMVDRVTPARAAIRGMGRTGAYAPSARPSFGETIMIRLFGASLGFALLIGQGAWAESGLATLETCLEKRGTGQSFAEYTCAETAYFTCVAAEGVLAECLDPLQARLRGEVDAVIEALPARAPKELMLEQSEYRSLKRGLKAGIRWPGCPDDMDLSQCTFMTVTERWVEARALRAQLEELSKE